MIKLVINTLPKSGTHLMNKLLDSMGYQFSGGNFSSTTLYGKNELIKFLFRGVMMGQSGVDLGLDIPAVVRSSWVRKTLLTQQDGQYCGGHLPYSEDMYSLLQQADIRMLYMLRDPRDVLLSWAHYVPNVEWHYGRGGLVGLNLEQCVRMILYGYHSKNFFSVPFSEMLTSSYGWARHTSTFVVKFEDLVGGCGGGCDDAQLSTIEKIASFAEVGGGIDVAKILKSLFGGTKVFRKGQIGSWKNELSSALVNEINEMLEINLIEMGYQ